MRIWVCLLFIAFACSILTGVLAFYLDFRRMNLVQSGVLPKTTPEIFRLRHGFVFSSVGLDIPYVFSDRLAKSPDSATRRWTPWLRVGIGTSGGLFALTVLAALFT